MGALQARTELHPALKQAQRQQADDNRRREAAKPPPAFNAHKVGEHALDHPALPSGLGVRALSLPSLYFVPTYVCAADLRCQLLALCGLNCSALGWALCIPASES
jgi:hypothetical protein